MENQNMPGQQPVAPETGNLTAENKKVILIILIVALTLGCVVMIIDSLKNKNQSPEPQSIFTQEQSAPVVKGMPQYKELLSDLVAIGYMEQTMSPWFYMWRQVLPDLKLEQFKKDSEYYLSFETQAIDANVVLSDKRQIKQVCSEYYKMYVDPYYGLDFKIDDNKVIVTKSGKQNAVLADEVNNKQGTVLECDDDCQFDDVYWKACALFVVLGNKKTENDGVVFYQPLVIYADLDHRFYTNYLGPKIKESDFAKVNNYWNYKFNDKLTQLIPEDQRPKKMEDDPVYKEFNLIPSVGYKIHTFIKSHRGDEVVYSESTALTYEDIETSGGQVNYRVYTKSKNSGPNLISAKDLQGHYYFSYMPSAWSADDSVIFFRDWAIVDGPGGNGQLAVYNPSQPQKGIYGLASETYIIDETENFIAYTEISEKTISYCYPEGGDYNSGKLIIKNIKADEVIYTLEAGATNYELTQFKNDILDFTAKTVIEADNSDEESYCAQEVEPIIKYHYNVATKQLFQD